MQEKISPSQDIKDASNDDYQKNIYHFILNESAAKQLGWTAQEAIGKKMFLGNERPGIVAGVVKDFHFESLHTPIKPFVLFPETLEKATARKSIWRAFAADDLAS